MESFVNWSRRRFLLQAGGGALAYAAGRSQPRAMEGMGMRRIAPRQASSSFNPDVEIELTCRPSSISILPGDETEVWRYCARLISGPEVTLTSLPGSYLGSVMRFSKGQRIRIRLRNALPESTITHWHGLHVPMLMDGHPIYAIDPGGEYVYEFEMLNRASMSFYHPHTHEATATQVYRGLAGVILINDEEERSLDLPSGEYEIPIVIQDRTFDDENQLIYGGAMHYGMMHGGSGFYGERILVNGKPNFRIDVSSRSYRFRILNASNARIYKLAWDDGSPITVIGTDGGLLERPEEKPYVILAPAERLDVWADFSGRKAGSQLAMRSRAIVAGRSRRGGGTMAAGMCGGGMHGRMGGGMMDGNGLPVARDHVIFTVNVSREVSDSPSLPKRLAKIERYRLEDVANPERPVPIAVSTGPMSMSLNGRPYEFDNPQPSERIPVDTLQLMEIFHARGAGMHGMAMMGGMAMASMSHPIHLHGQCFQVLDRLVDEDYREDYADISEGFVDSGLKDTVLVTIGERVRIIKPFQDFKGRFMYHCHILEHEDMGMMREFVVE